MATNTTEIMMANRIMADILLFMFIVASILGDYLFAYLFKTCSMGYASARLALCYSLFAKLFGNLVYI